MTAAEAEVWMFRGGLVRDRHRVRRGLLSLSLSLSLSLTLSLSLERREAGEE
jgi:hypothetical protein